MTANKALKIAGVAAAVVTGLAISLLVVAKLLITPERVRKTVLPLAEKALKRKVQLGEITVSIFSGIILKDLVVADREGTEPFVSAGQVKLRYQLWPLLSKRVVVDEIFLEAPQVKVVRLPDGTFNFSDIVKKEPKKPEEKPEPRREIDLLVSKVALTKGTVRYEDRSAKPPAPFTTSITGIEFSSSDVSLDKPFPFSARAMVPGAAVEVKGKIADAAAKPSVDAVVKVIDADLQKITGGLPPKLAGSVRPLDPSGIINAQFHLSGPVAAGKDLLKTGEMRLDKIQVTASGQRPSLAGVIALKGSSVTSDDLALTLGENRLAIQFSASNIFARPITLTSSIRSERFNLDPFLKKEAATPKGVARDAGTADKPEAKPLKIPLRATGTAQIGQTAYKGLPVSQLLLRYRLIDNILTVDELKGNVAGGTFSDTAQVDLNRPGFSYATKLKVQGVQANPVVSAFAPKAADTVFGTLSLNADLSGSGTRPPSIRKNISGRGDFTIAEGKLTGAGLVEGLAQFINLEQLRVLQFSKFAGNFRVEKGSVILDSGVSGKDVRITPKGTVGLDKTLDLSLTTSLSPALTSRMVRGDLGKFVTDEQGWGIIPLKAGGTLSSPKFRMDASAVKEQVRTKAKEKLQQTIEEKLLKKKEGEPQRPEREILEKGLRGIFGK